MGLHSTRKTTLEHHFFMKAVLAFVAVADQLCAQEHRATTSADGFLFNDLLTAKKAQEIVRERQLDERVTSATANLR